MKDIKKEIDEEVPKDEYWELEEELEHLLEKEKIRINSPYHEKRYIP